MDLLACFRMVLLLMLLGALFVYLLIVMAMIASLVAVAISGLVYVLTYMVSYAWAAVRHRKSPEWKFEKKPWTPDMSRFQEYSVVAGIASMVAMVLGLLAYAFSDGDWVTTIGISSVAIPFAWLVMHADTEEPKGPQPPESPKTFDRSKFSS